MGRTPKAKTAKSAAAAFATPQLSGAVKRQKLKILKSEPPPKRKKLAQELDDEISDKEFDTQLGIMRENETKRKIKKHSDQNSRRAVSNSTDEDSSEDDETEESDEEDDEESDDEGATTEDDEDEDVSDSENDSGSETDGEDDDDERSDEEDEDMDVSSDAERSEDDNGKISKSNLEKRQKTTKADSAKRPKQKTDKKAGEICQIEAVEMSKDLVAKASRDKRTLFLKSLPKSVTIKEIQALSADITEVRMHICKDRRGNDLKCAYVEFADEKIAVKNKSSLNEKKINNQAISVDYVGEKSAFKSSNPPASSSLDPKKLYVSGFGNSIGAEDLKKLFPTASSIDLPCYKKEDCPKGFAFVHFVDEKLCKAAHASVPSQSINGKQLTVMYAKHHKARKPKRNRRRKGANSKIQVSELPKSEKKDCKEKKAIDVTQNQKKKSKI